MSEPTILFCRAGSPSDGAPHQFMAAFWLASRGLPVRCLCQPTAEESRAGRIGSPLGGVQVTAWAGRGAVGQAGLAAALLRHRARAGGRSVFYVQGHTVTPAAWVALAGVPAEQIIYHTQDYLQPGRHPAWEFFERRVARRAGAVIVNEANRARCLAGQYGLAREPLVARTALPAAWPVPGRDAALRQRLLARLAAPPGSGAARLVIHHGPFSAERCSATAVQAVARLPAEYVLVFTGSDCSGPRAEAARREARSAGIEGRTVFVERTTFDSALAHVACGDVGLLLYPNDGIGNYYQSPGRLTEYLRCGVPVVASAFPGFEDLVLRRELGAVCDPESPDSVARAIAGASSRLAGDGPSRERLIRIAATDLAYDAQADRIEAAVRSALGGASR